MTHLKNEQTTEHGDTFTVTGETEKGTHVTETYRKGGLVSAQAVRRPVPTEADILKESDRIKRQNYHKYDFATGIQAHKYRAEQERDNDPAVIRARAIDNLNRRNTPKRPGVFARIFASKSKKTRRKRKISRSEKTALRRSIRKLDMPETEREKLLAKLNQM